MANVSFLRKSADGKWLHCPQCSKAYWGAFRPTDFVRGKFDAHCAKAHKAAEAGDAPADANLAGRHATTDTPCSVQGCLGCPPRARAARPAPRARNARQIAKIAERAAAKGDGEVRVVRESPNTAEILGAQMANDLFDIALMLNPRLQGGQGPRMFADEGGDRVRQSGRKFNARVAA